MNSLKSHEQKFWQAYLQEAGILDSHGLTVSAGMPGDEQVADELVSLYLSGQKTAGSGLLKDFEQAGVPLPEVGNFWIILDSHARPRCIVRVIRVEMHLFREVTEEIARAEGEGDLSLEYWRKAHQRLFSRFLEKLGITNLNEERIVVEFYELVYRERSAAAKTPTSIAHAYDCWSSFYDAYPNPTVAADELKFPKFWKHLSHKSVLEIGCGTGRHTRKLIAQSNRLTAVDPSAGMLERARALGLPGVEWIMGDFMEVKLGTYDAVVCSLVLEHIENLDCFFAKLARVLKPDGEFWLSEIHPSRAAKGSVAHFKDPISAEEVWLGSYVHGEEAVRMAAERVGFKLMVEEDGLADEEFVAIKEEWTKYIGLKMVKIWGFRSST
jgi:uncharacterized protein YhfF/ubiquinone/menaquinone biosynthesis C-methylase UbiE